VFGIKTCALEHTSRLRLRQQANLVIKEL